MKFDEISRYTEEELNAKYDIFMKIIERYMPDHRIEKLKHMYSQDELGQNLLISPASSRRDYHNAFEGGYIDHILNVCKNAMKIKKAWEEAGAEIDFTDEELMFIALHHDLGKLGTKEEPHYIPNQSQWHVKNQGKYYEFNPNLSYMSHTDRTFLLLNNYGFKLSEQEYLGITLTDGLYDESNREYLISFSYEKAIQTPLYHIMHQADLMSSYIEQQNQPR